MGGILRASHQNRERESSHLHFLVPNSTSRLTLTDVKQKVIFHLEAFVAKFMRILEGYVKCADSTGHHME